MSGGAHVDRFTSLRPLLFTIAYEILGSSTESDDVLQESYLRWAEVDLADVTDAKAYLAKLVTRQALNALRSQARRREEYVGPWLPEPLLLDTADPSADVVLAESVSMAMMVVLETLSPDERAVFVLREVFGFGHDDIASTIGKSTAAVRQMAHRAREHVQSRRKRFDPVDPKRSLELTAQFFATASTGDVPSLIAMLAPDVVWTADSDGKASAARRPITGADKVARLVVGLARFTVDGGRVEPAFYNGAPALVLYLHDKLEGVVSVEIIDGLITHFYAMRNPEKLGGVLVAREIARTERPSRSEQSTRA
jgi:RNA polymerase sigma-70 factor (ECF subfamily)